MPKQLLDISQYGQDVADEFVLDEEQLVRLCKMYEGDEIAGIFFVHLARGPCYNNVTRYSRRTSRFCEWRQRWRHFL